MQEKYFLVAGIVCVVAGIVGGNVEIFGAKIPELPVIPRAMLGGLGALFLVLHYINRPNRGEEVEADHVGAPSSRSYALAREEDGPHLGPTSHHGSDPLRQQGLAFLFSAVAAAAITTILILLDFYAKADSPYKYVDLGKIPPLLLLPLGGVIGWLVSQQIKGIVLGLIAWFTSWLLCLVILAPMLGLL